MKSSVKDNLCTFIQLIAQVDRSFKIFIEDSVAQSGLIGRITQQHFLQNVALKKKNQYINYSFLSEIGNNQGFENFVLILR